MTELVKWYGTAKSLHSTDEKTRWYLLLGIHKKGAGYLVAEVGESGDLYVTDNTLDLKYFLSLFLEKWGYKELSKEEANKLGLYRRYIKTGILVGALEL